MHWPRFLNEPQVLLRSVTLIPLFARALVSASLTFELRERTELGDLGLVAGLAEAWPPSADALLLL